MSRRSTTATRTATVAWLLTATCYFYQYTLPSAPAVMMPELSTTPRRVVPIGAATVGVGALLFATGNAGLASVGRFLQGAGGVFALVGAAFIATTNFPASRAATLIDATQMFAMAGGSAGGFLVGPLIAASIAWSTSWIGMGVARLAMSLLLFALLRESTPAHREADWLKGAGRSLLLGWIVRCPLLGLLSDRLGRRKPAIVSGALLLLACMAWILNFTFSAFLGPVFGWLLVAVSGGAGAMTLEHYQTAFEPPLYGVALATLLTLFLKETGPAVRVQERTVGVA